MTLRSILPGFCLALAACGSPADRAPASNPADGPSSPAPANSPAGERQAGPPAEPIALATALTRAQWLQADNREDCAPLVLTGGDLGGGAARSAQFSGGWAVAFDLPDLRSAYGVAGAGLIAVDDQPAAAQEARLRQQWPYFTMLPALPQPAFAGYGLEGARAYPPEAPEGRGEQSLAYVRVGGERCTYNVWSKLGRGHLELLLQSLRRL